MTTETEVETSNDWNDKEKGPKSSPLQLILSTWLEIEPTQKFWADLNFLGLIARRANRWRTSDVCMA